MKIRNTIATVAVIGSTLMSGSAMAQVTNVNQLSDVQPTSWAYQSISNLISRLKVLPGKWKLDKKFSI